MLMKVNGMYINLDACPCFEVWQDGEDVCIGVGGFNHSRLMNVKEWEVHAAIAYKLEKDPKNFELMNTINFLRRVHGDD